MAKTAYQKLKVLHIIRFLVMNSDKSHPVKISDIIAYLAAQGISAERKSIYDDMDALRTCGYNIIFTGRGNGSGYYLDDQNCDEIELKIAATMEPQSVWNNCKRARLCNHKV